MVFRNRQIPHSLKPIPLLTIIAGILLLFFAVWLSIPTQSASAQCGISSSCKTCHETQKALSVNASGVWHTDHAVSDFCADCHGGDKSSSDKATAHIGMTTDLTSMKTTCQDCHNDNCDTLFQTYSAALTTTGGTTTGATGTATTADPLSSFLGENPASVDDGSSAASPTTPSTTAEKTVNRTGNWILIGLIGLVSAGGGSYVYWNERRLKNQAPQPPVPVVEPVAPANSDRALVQLLDRLKPETREALESLLDDPGFANDLFNRLVDLDDEALDVLSSAKPKRIAQALKSTSHNRS